MGRDLYGLLPQSKDKNKNKFQFSSVAQLCPTIHDPMDCSMPDFPVHHQLLNLAQTHVHRVSDAVQPSHPLSSPYLGSSLNYPGLAVVLQAIEFEISSALELPRGHN